jgi:benzoyl-CoA reductase/2-hydroxyglutaryl-CoA dehydratase subunit BcrC/BadD/HgdB
VWGPAGVDPVDGASHFQSYTCGIVRNAASFLLTGGLDVADLLVVPHTCDALQGMGSVLKDFIEIEQEVATLYLPRGGRPADLEYLVDELRAMGRTLSAWGTVQPSDEELLEVILADERADGALASLIERRAEIALGDRDFYALLRAREYLPSDDFTALADQAPRHAEPPAPPGGIPVLLSGIVPEPMEIFDAIEDAGGRVAGDDLACCSRRLYPAGTSDDPYRRLAERFMATPPCPTRGTPILERARFLAERVNDVQARGVIIYDPKFCEPELFDIPLIRGSLEELGFPVLHVEFDFARTLSHQTLTRIEAFMEVLG